MKKYAVGFINFFFNDLKITIVEADDWQDALEKAHPNTVDYMPDDIEAAKAKAFDQDWMFDVVEIQ